MGKRMQGNIMLLVAAMIWGSAFVAQSAGMEFVGPFTYNMSRSFVGFLVLVPVVLIFRRMGTGEQRKTPAQWREVNVKSVRSGAICGVVLAFASGAQQIGVSMTTAGKAGFITALYIIIVPILGIFLRKRVSGTIWVCAAVAVAGFYLLCVNEGLSVSAGDLMCLLCAVCFSVHIMVIDRFTSEDTDGILMSCVQFLVAGILSAVPALLFESPTLGAIWDARLTILYAGALSSGVGYTLQILAQRNTDPTVASLLMSLESVFAAVSGCLILGEVLSGREIAGCALVFAAVILAQVRK